MKKENNGKKKVVSLRKKSVTVVLAAAVILSFIAVSISGIYYSYSMFNHYKKLAEQLADTAAAQMSADDIVRYYNEVKTIGDFDEDKYWNDDAYRAEYDKKANALKDEKYKQMLNNLYIFEEKSIDRSEIKFIYVQVLEGDKVTYIFDADTTEDAYQLGTVHAVSEATKQMESPENGIPAFVSNSDDGWLCSCMRPVRDSNGKPVALVGVDISMAEVVKSGIEYLAVLSAIMVVATALFILILVKGVEKTLVKPINMLSEAARSFVEDRSEDTKDTSAVSQLNIHTGDEVEVLSDSIKQMELDINDYITNLTAVTAEKERIGAELDVATHIQSSMLPSIFPSFTNRTEFDIAASMEPAKEVGGDFYDFFMVDENNLAIVMADVSGKGVPAALFMVIGKTLIKDHTSPGTDLGTVFSEVNNILCDSNSEGLFITAFEGVLNLKTGEFRYVNAGHEPPFISHGGDNFDAFKIKPGFVLAGMEDMKYTSGVITLSPGDKLFQYTDGVTEATNSENELYGMERLEAALNKVKDLTPEEILPAIKEDMDAFVGDAPQFDDITMLCLNFKKYREDGE